MNNARDLGAPTADRPPTCPPDWARESHSAWATGRTSLHGLDSHPEFHVGRGLLRPRRQDRDKLDGSKDLLSVSFLPVAEGCVAGVEIVGHLFANPGHLARPRSSNEDNIVSR